MYCIGMYIFGGVWIDTENIPWMLNPQWAEVIPAEPVINPGV